MVIGKAFATVIKWPVVEKGRYSRPHFVKACKSSKGNPSVYEETIDARKKEIEGAFVNKREPRKTRKPPACRQGRGHKKTEKGL